MIEQQISEYLKSYDCKPLVFNRSLSYGTTVFVCFKYKRRIIEIQFTINHEQEYISVTKKIPTKNLVVSKMVERLLVDLLEFIKEKSKMRLYFLFKDYKKIIYGSPYNPFLRKIRNWFDETLVFWLFAICIILPVFILFFAFRANLLFGLCAVPGSLSIPLVIYAGMKYVIADEARVAQEAKTMITYSGIGMLISLLALIVLKVYLSFT